MSKQINGIGLLKKKLYFPISIYSIMMNGIKNWRKMEEYLSQNYGFEMS